MSFGLAFLIIFGREMANCILSKSRWCLRVFSCMLWILHIYCPFGW